VERTGCCQRGIARHRSAAVDTVRGHAGRGCHRCSKLRRWHPLRLDNRLLLLAGPPHAEQFTQLPMSLWPPCAVASRTLTAQEAYEERHDVSPFRTGIDGLLIVARGQPVDQRPIG